MTYSPAFSKRFYSFSKKELSLLAVALNDLSIKRNKLISKIYLEGKKVNPDFLDLPDIYALQGEINDHTFANSASDSK